VNKQHQECCPSPEWAAYLQDEVLPAVADGRDLGATLLEVGPGPGASTDWLRHRVERLVAVEIEPEAAARLEERFADTNVEIGSPTTAWPAPSCTTSTRTTSTTRSSRARC
jgi:hypothetical protein